MPKAFDKANKAGAKIRTVTTGRKRNLEMNQDLDKLVDVVNSEFSIMLSKDNIHKRFWQRLHQNERLVLTGRLGLVRGPKNSYYEPMSLENIGRLLWVTRERVRQIEKRALRKLAVDVYPVARYRRYVEDYAA